MLILLTLLGLAVGSFINSFLWRYQTKTTNKGRSMCPACKHQLSWKDNIPIISWLLLKGKCRYCQGSISVQYPIVEILTGLAFLIVGLFSKDGIYVNHVASAMIGLSTVFALDYFMLGVLKLIMLLLISALLIMISVYDYKTKEIPNSFNLAFFGFSASYLIIYQLPKLSIQHTLYHILAATTAFLFFYAFVYFSKETWMGGGDAKMAFGMGLLLGPLNTFLAILLASVIGSIYGVTVLFLSRPPKKQGGDKKKNFSHEIPFGPFLALGTYISLIFGTQMIDWYVKIILGI